MVKTPYMEPCSPSIRTIYNPYIVPLQGVLTMAHMGIQHLGKGSLPRLVATTFGGSGDVVNLLSNRPCRASYGFLWRLIGGY